MQKRIRKKLTFLIILFLLVASVVLFISSMLTKLSDGSVLKLKDGWRVSYGGQEYTDVDFEDPKGSGIAFSDDSPVAELHMTLPDIPGDEDFPMLFFRTKQCAIEVLLDGELIYNADMDRALDGRFIHRRMHLIDLPADYAGRELDVRLYFGHQRIQYGFIAPELGGYIDIGYRYVQRNFFAICVGGFLLVYGFVFLFITTVSYIGTPNVRPQIYSALLSLVLGIFITCHYGLAELIVRGPGNTLVEYAAIYVYPFLLYLALTYIHERSKETYFVIAGRISGIAFVIFMLLHLTGIAYVTSMQMPFAIVGAIDMWALAKYDIKHRRSIFMNPSTSVQEIGFLIHIFFMLVFLFCFVIQTETGVGAAVFYDTLYLLGALFFVISQLLNFFIYISESYARRQDYASLTRLAFVDVLTGLPNRKSYDEYMENIIPSGEDYCIVSIDLNGLKEVNDNLGHDVGDRLLRGAADALNHAFGDVAFRARIGGDEFAVVFNNADEELVRERVTRMKDYLERLDIDEPTVNHSAAAGYAFYHERASADKDASTVAEEVFALADERMYEDKRR